MYEMTDLIKISPAEREVLRALLQSDTNQEIADALFLSRHTVKTHVSRLLTKFDVASKHRLVDRAYCWGFIAQDGEVLGGQ